MEAGSGHKRITTQRNTAQPPGELLTLWGERDREDEGMDDEQTDKEQTKPRPTSEWAHHGDKSDSSHPPSAASRSAGAGLDWHCSLTVGMTPDRKWKFGG